MAETIGLGTKFELAKPFRLQWEKAQGSFVLLYPEGMIALNESGGLVLDLCCLQGKTVGQTTRQLKSEFEDENIGHDVDEFLRIAYGNRWIQIRKEQEDSAVDTC